MMREHVRIVFAIGAEHDALDLDFVIPTFGEQRTNRAVDQAAGENFLFGRTAFALEIAAGEFSGCGRFFAVIDGEREEILARLWPWWRATAATMTMVSPSWTVTAPSACLASFPVSMMICLSPMGAVALSGIINFAAATEKLQ